jgi:hypothetical protein
LETTKNKKWESGRDGYKRKTGAIIADSTLYNPKKPNENFLNITL